MRWRALFRPAGVLCALVAAQPAPAGAEPPFERLARIVERLGAEGEFSGAIVVMRDGGEVFAQGVGFADRAALRRFTPDTPSDTGSIAKSVTGTLVLQHAATGRLRLDDPVVDWLPAYPHRETRLADLVTHSAGLPDYDRFEDLYTPGPLSNAAVLAALPARQPAPAFPPGTRFEYCNLCLDMLAEVVARAGGAPYATQAIDGLLKPLGATGAFVRPARLADWPVPRTIGYRGTEILDSFDNETVQGASNIIASARDLARWADAWAGGRAVAPAVEQAALAGTGPGITPGQWMCNDRRSSCHYTGHHQGFDALAWWDREAQLAIAFVSNGGTSPWLLHRLPRMVRAASLGQTPVLPPEPMACRAERDPATLAGGWRLADGRHLEIEPRGARMALALPGARAADLFRVGPGTFYAPGLDRFLCSDGEQLLIFSLIEDAQATRAPGGIAAAGTPH